MHILAISPLLLFISTVVSTLLVSYSDALKGLGLSFLTYFATLLLSGGPSPFTVFPFHPLARYPGLLPAKVTKLYHVSKIWEGRQHLYMKELHDRYADIVRAGKLLVASKKDTS